MLRNFPKMYSRYLATNCSSLSSPATPQHNPSLCADPGHDPGDGNFLPPLGSFLLTQAASNQPVTKCCLWSRPKRRRSTYSQLSPPNLQPGHFPSNSDVPCQAENVINTHAPSSSPSSNPRKLCPQHLPRCYHFWTRSVRTAASQPLQA